MAKSEDLRIVNRLKSKKQADAIKDYVAYIKRHLNYIRGGLIECEDNEVYFYKALYNKIMNWSKNNKVWFALITRNATGVQASSEFNISERAIVWGLRAKRIELYNNIIEWEKELEKQYPHNRDSAKFTFDYGTSLLELME